MGSEPVVEDRDLLLDPAEPTGHERAGGAGRELGILMTVGGLLGAWASVMLVLSHMTLLENPAAALACDVNPVVGCGSFVLSWQASLFGIPNAIIGAVAFASVLTVGVVMLSGARLPAWFWRALLAGATGAVGWVLWFQYQALTQLRGLCPYCLVVWAVTIALFVHLLARAAQAGHVPVGEQLRRTLVQDRWVAVAVWYGLVTLAALVAFWDQWLALLA